jgi:hypothetical protein
MSRRSKSCLFLVALALIGCKSRESQLAGKWSNGNATVLTLSPDKTFSMPVYGSAVATGAWSFDGADVTLTTKAIGGKPIEEVKSRFQDLASRLGSKGTAVRAVADDLDKPNVFKLSEDGKTLTTDRSVDKNHQPMPTLTKQG